jgi:hypothetical protein
MKEGGKQSLGWDFALVSCLAYFLALKMEAKYSSETSVDLQRTTRLYIPEASSLLGC